MDLPARPEDIDAAWLRAALGLPPDCPRALSAHRIGEGFGLDGTVARLHLDGAPGLPPTLVAKACDGAKGEREARFYTEIAPRLDLALPTFHGRFTDGSGGRAILLLGDVGPAKQGDVLAGLEPEEAAAVVAAEASFHAAFWDRAVDPAVSPLPSWERDPAREAARTGERIPAFLAGWGDRVPAAARVVTERLPTLLPAAFEALAEAPPTLLHADLHADNLLFPAQGPPVLLDWPDAGVGPAAVDFGRLLLEGLTVDVRRSLEERLAVLWVEEAGRRGVEGYGVQRLRADADLAILVAWGWVVRWAAREKGFPSEGPRTGAIVENLVVNGAAFWADRPPR